MKKITLLFISFLSIGSLCIAQVSGNHPNKQDSSVFRKNVMPNAQENDPGVNSKSASGVYAYSVTTSAYNILCTYSNSGASGMPLSEFACKTFPVKLISFNGDYDNETNIASLTWATSCEWASRFFIIMRSSDGTIWKTIDTLLAAGNSDQTSHYAFSDLYPPEGSIYYKLVLEDNQGKLQAFNPITINIIPSAIIKAYPSLSGHLVYMQGDIQTIKVINSQGVKVNDSMDDNADQTSFVNVSMLRNGLYLIQATNTTGKVLMLKFAKQ